MSESENAGSRSSARSSATDGENGGAATETRRALRIAGVAALAVVAVGTIAALVVRDQISRQRRNLFNPIALRRMAALEHMARQEPSVDHINLLRDYLAWEPRKLLRNRAQSIVERMERRALDRVGSVEEPIA